MAPIRTIGVMAWVTLALAAPATSSCSPNTTKAQEAHDAAIVSAASDQALNAAGQDAVKTLPVFWSKWRTHTADYSDFRVKVGLPTDDPNGEEYIWMTVNNVDAEQQIHGQLSNEPAQMAKLHHGSRVSVDPSRVVDWMYVKGGKAYGNFTTRVLMRSANAAQRTEAESFLAPTPLEITK